jgi:RNA recognition motif-containing protein
LIKDPDTGRSKGYAFIEMDSKESATKAKEKFNGQILHVLPLKVNDAQPRNWYQNSAGYISPRQP